MTQTQAAGAQQAEHRIPPPSGAREPLKTNIYELMRNTSTQLVPQFPYFGPGAMLPAGKGSIVNIASVAGFVSLSDRYPMAGYAASKHGVVGLTRELGAQWAARGVRVNAIAPGWFPTELTGQLRDQEQVRWIERRTPIGRPGRLQELDAALVFLAADGSSYMVGQTIVVDGGWTIL